MNIAELARIQQMQPTPPAPTERAQIVFNYTFASPAPIYRFNNAKKARAEYERIVKMWKEWQSHWHNAPKKKPSRFVDIKADMFDGTIDLDLVASINFVEWPKRDKFIPQG